MDLVILQKNWSNKEIVLLFSKKNELQDINSPNEHHSKNQSESFLLAKSYQSSFFFLPQSAKMMNFKTIITLICIIISDVWQPKTYKLRIGRACVNTLNQGFSLRILYCVVDIGYGLGRYLGDYRPALPKGRKYQMVKTQTESHNRRPIV